MVNWRRHFPRKSSRGTAVNSGRNKAKDNVDASIPPLPPLGDTSDHPRPQQTVDVPNGPSKPSGEPFASSTRDVYHEPQRDGSQMGSGRKDKKDYWQMAVQQLQEEDANIHDQIVAIQRAARGDGSTDLATQLQTTTERKRKALEAKKWKIVVGGKEINVREQFDRIVKGVLLVKDIAKAAGSIDPLHAGIPVAGLCVLLQMAVSDSEQYAAMLDGVDEIVTVVARYHEIETLYRSRAETGLTQEFEKRLVSLYKHVVRYYIAATSYYQRSTMVNILRSFPQLGDVSPILAAVQKDDRACKDIGQVFDSADALERHEEMLKRFDQLQQYFTGQQTSNTPSQRYPIHRTGSRSTNKLFIGRDDVLCDLEKAIRDALGQTLQQSQIVITGMGGLGKSELCLQLTHQLQSLFWGLFWVDVSTDSLAAAGYLEIAKQVGIPAQTWEEARQGVANLQKPWLLVLDNADDPNVDYAPYFPGGTKGVVLMTSRNTDCSQHATTKHIALDALSDVAAQELLLNAAQVIEDERPCVQEDAAAVASLLQSHPLAIIQAGAYVSRGHCTLAEYPTVYERQRQRLLAFRPTQARSRYGDVYATFEASALALQSLTTEAGHDALQLLPVLAAYGTSPLTLSLFEAAWKGGRSVTKPDEDRVEINKLTQWHASHLPSVIPVSSATWDSFRLVEAVQLLKSFSLVVVARDGGGVVSVSMHPLIHSWTRDRQNESEQHGSWLYAGCIVALSYSLDGIWQQRTRQLQPHLQAMTLWKTSIMFAQEAPRKVACVLVRCGWLLNQMRDDNTLFMLMQKVSAHLNLDQSRVDPSWVSLHEVMAENYYNHGDIKQAVALSEEVVRIRKMTLEETHPFRLASQHTLAVVYEANGQIKEAVTLLEEIVRIEKTTLEETHPSRLASQHTLAVVYEANGQVKEAVTLLEEVVRIRKTTLEETHPFRLVSQHTLAVVYEANGQIKEAVTLLEEVVRIRKMTLEETHPFRLASQHTLAVVYEANGQIKEAVTLLEEIVRIEKTTLEETHPSRLASQHALAGVYKANGQVKEAVTLLEEVVRIRKTTLEETHPSRLASQHALAGVYKANGQVKEAVTLLEEVVRIRKTTLEETHPDRLMSQLNLAVYYWTLNRHQEAYKLMKYVANIYRRRFDDNFPSRRAAEEWLKSFEDVIAKELLTQ